MNGSRVTASTAGIESTAKIRSVVSTATSTASSGVANRAPRGVGGDAAGDEHEAAGAHDIGEVADGLGHPGNADLFTPTDSVHGPHLVSKFEELLVRAPVRSPATT